MPESLVAVTQGSGKNLHTFNRTIGANSVEDEVVVLGEPYLATGTLMVGGISTATTASHLLQIMAGSTLKVRIRRFTIIQDTVAGAAAQLKVEIRRLTTAGTGGSAVTAGGSFDTTDTLTAAGMALPTVKGTEGAFLLECAMGLGTAQPITTAFVWEAGPARGSKPIIIPAGTANGLAWKVQTGIASATVEIIVEYSESNF